MLTVQHDPFKGIFRVSRGTSLIASLPEISARSFAEDVRSIFNQAKDCPSQAFMVPNVCARF
jgi:hypothetical protein